MKRISILSLLLLAFQVGFSQSNVVEYIKAGQEDANQLFKAYLNPFAQALGDGLNKGWYYTAETHKRLGFDLSMSMTVVRIPKSAQTFDVSKLNLSNVTIDPAFGTIAPTAAGIDSLGPQLNLMDPNQPDSTIASFRTPPGMNMTLIPVPVAQLGIGLFPHTDVLVRYVPKLAFNQNSENHGKIQVGMFGIGVKHNFKEWVPVLKNLPFDAAVLATYSKVDANSKLHYGLSNYGNGFSDASGGYEPDKNQRLNLKTNTMKVGLIVSKKVAFITFFGGISNSRSHTEIDMLGRYPVVIDVQNNEPVVADQVDPIQLSFASSRVSMDAGVRMKLAFFNLYGSVNKAEYSSFNVGLALSVR